MMITRDIKNTAISLLTMGNPVDTVADELDLPEALVNEWAGSLKDKDVQMIKATNNAINVLGRDIEDPEAQPRIRRSLEDVAELLIIKLNDAVLANDLVLARTINICADSVSKLHSCFVAKASPDSQGKLADINNVTTFQNLLRD